MTATAPDTSLSAAEIQEFRRLIASRRRFGNGVDPLAATLIGVFAAGFLGLIGWMGFETMSNGKAVAGLQADVATLRAGQEKLEGRLVRLEGGQEKLNARLVRLEAGQEETNRKLDRLLAQ